MERTEQGTASKHIRLGWSEQSKENQSRSEFVNQREMIILDQIGPDQIESDQIRVSIYEWIGSEQTYCIGSRGSDST